MVVVVVVVVELVVKRVDETVVEVEVVVKEVVEEVVVEEVVVVVVVVVAVVVVTGSLETFLYTASLDGPPQISSNAPVHGDEHSSTTAAFPLNNASPHQHSLPSSTPTYCFVGVQKLMHFSTVMASPGSSPHPARALSFVLSVQQA